MTDGNNPPSLRTDTLTQLILDWDANDPSNPYMTIKEVIDEWEWDINSDNEETEQELVSMLYEKHQYEWNDGYKRGKAFLRLNEKLQEALDEHEIENANWG